MKQGVFFLCYILSINLLAQNVGINVTNPTAALDVNGNFKLADGTQGMDKVLTSDANGLASWQASTSSSLPTAGYGKWGECENPNLSEYQPHFDDAGGFFGGSVAIDGDFAVVSAQAATVSGNINAGTVTIYQFNGTHWNFYQKLSDPSPEPEAFFGLSVAINGNYIAVGSPNDNVGSNADQGSVCIFAFDGASWNLLQKLHGVDAQANDLFGYSVGISNEKIVIGSLNDAPSGTTAYRGSATIYHYFNFSGLFIYNSKFYHPDSFPDTNFGQSVAIDENRIVVGAPNTLGEIGSAHVYQYSGSTWIFDEYLVSPYAEIGDFFGYDVDIDGDEIIIGAPYKDANGLTNTGEVHFFRTIAGNWNWVCAKNMAIMADEITFGFNVSISNGYAMAGCDQLFFDAGRVGSVVLFQRSNNGWNRMGEVKDPAKEHLDKMQFCAVDGVSQRFVLGAPGNNGFVGKAIFGKFNY